MDIDNIFICCGVLRIGKLVYLIIVFLFLDRMDVFEWNEILDCF